MLWIKFLEGALDCMGRIKIYTTSGVVFSGLAWSCRGQSFLGKDMAALKSCRQLLCLCPLHS